MTKKQLLTAFTAPNVRVKAEIVGPMITLTEWPQKESELLALGWLPRNNANVYDAPDNSGRYVGRPQIQRVRAGHLALTKGAKYTFRYCDELGERESHGDVASLKMQGDSLELVMCNGSIMRYSIANN